jgi:ferredoxin
MEGNGPGDGIPKKLGIIVSGTKAFLLDSVIAHMVGFDIEEIAYLRLAKKLGHINDNDIQSIYTVPLLFPVMKAPPRPFLSKVLGHNKLMKLRDITRPLFSHGLITNMLYRANIIQDVYENDDAEITDLNINVNKCLKECNRCKDVCPMGLDVTSNDFNFLDDPCIQCLYCFWICPTDAVKIEGKTGYLQQHFQRYKHHVEKFQN